ncbi:hypothetical protein MCOR25_001213 [Pyricularia grisea]|uniref:Uncharacterized protein n=1 Tax=Pyricularia grisea TaxID=148305 RepID=A0A6P8B8B7_PYRGI|nr:hypothetical protein PgNI_05190 [Pyricularia grisea]KAI6381520.1 hypothetical protein MCOR25_001213 [Pyricularia grisea]TLD11349.1 hypothetical protein PgNI_05190 [Pyricularia grisea]
MSDHTLRPALKGPAIASLKPAKNNNTVYTGTLERGNNDIGALSDCLRTAWACLGGAAVDWAGFISGYCAIQDKRSLSMLRGGLPLYQWDHRREFWAKPRIGRLFCTQQHRVHELLAKRRPDGTAEAVR